MHILGFLDTLSEGSFFFEGVDVGMLSGDQLAYMRGRKIGFVFQAFNLLNRSTTLENVMLPLLYTDVPKKERIQRATELLERVGLGHRLNYTPGKLSGGEKQRVAIARALVSEPKILMLDEPAGGLGQQDIEWMNSLIRNLTAQMSVLIVEHHMDVVMSVCDRLYVLNFGELISSGEVETVRRDPAVVAAYLGVNN